MAGLSRYEQETIISYNQEEGAATVYTCNRTLISKLEKLRAKSPNISLEKEDKYGKTYICPKGWISINLPRQLSEKQRKEMALRLERMREAKKQA